jgi:hypothetical protein
MSFRRLGVLPGLSGGNCFWEHEGYTQEALREATK